MNPKTTNSPYCISPGVVTIVSEDIEVEEITLDDMVLSNIKTPQVTNYLCPN